MMKGQLSPSEWAVIQRAQPDEHKMEEAFRKFWSLKEAYTKGRGDGLGFEFKRCDFSLHEMRAGTSDQPVQFASVKVDGKQTPRWGFYVQPLVADHWISTARGCACRAAAIRRRCLAGGVAYCQNLCQQLLPCRGAFGHI